MDRLSVAALFDRNSTLFSTLFDTCLASLVALLTAVILSRSIYYDLSLILFAFVVAGTHVRFTVFSLFNFYTKFSVMVLRC